jgi:ParB family chromosome partitioning protein
MDNFRLVNINSIIVEREQRQRVNIDDIEELATSIQNIGLLNPIVITDENVLIAGERRLTACKSLGMIEIPAHYMSDLSDVERQLIELEENIKRKSISWQEEVKAVVTCHELYCDIDNQWSAEDTGETLGFSKEKVSRMLSFEKLADEDYWELPNFSTALNRLRRKRERMKNEQTKEIKTKVQQQKTPDVKPALAALHEMPTENIPSPHQEMPATFIHSSFVDVISLPKQINFYHCDFPYGVNVGDKIGQSSAKAHGGYEDSADIYFTLLENFLTSFVPATIGENAHCLFWFSMDYYHETKQAFEKLGWVVNPFPLIWTKSDNKGILPDANRGPRRVYETAFLCSFEDRKIVKPVGNFVSAPTTKLYHMSEKSYSMLMKFFEMLVDESTVMCDPTCGGGMALKAALDSGAEHVFGIDRELEYIERAKENVDRI